MLSKLNNLSGSKSDELELVDPVDKLIAAILANAAQDANRGDKAAIEWLDKAGQVYCESIGLNWLVVLRTVRSWADSPEERRPVRRMRKCKRFE